MKKIFAAGLSQESNSYNPLKSTYDDFYIYRGQELRQTPGLAALIDSGFDVVQSIWARAVPGGTLQFADFMRFVDEMLKPLEHDAASFEGVYLILHGALDVEHIGSGEMFIAARVREIVGPNVPIAAALDMHANVTFTLADTCNIIYGYRTAPHIDVAETHVRTANLLARAINERVLPQTQIFPVGLTMPGENMMTSSGIGHDIIEFLPQIEVNGVWCASYFVGMAWVDSYRNGANVVISGVGKMQAGAVKAQRLVQFANDNKDDFKYQGLALEPEDAIAYAVRHAGLGLVIISDSADNVTAGAAGDNAFLLNLFLQAGVENTLFAAIIDPILVEKAQKYNIGDVFDVQIGGVIDKNSHKADLCKSIIKKITHLDDLVSCVLSYRGIDVLVFNKRRPVFTKEVLQAHGLILSDYEILVVKQGYLSPELSEAAAFSAMALTPGNCDQKLERLETSHRPTERM